MRVQRSRRGHRRRTFYVWAFGLATLFTLLAITSFNPTALDRLTPLVFDAYQRIQPRAEAGAPVVVVDIDEASIAALGQWPWSRSVVARIVDRLGELGAATIAFDIIFSEKDRTSLGQIARDLEQAGATVIMPAGRRMPDNDAVLAEAFGRNNVTAGLVVSNETEAELPLPKAGFSFAGADPRAFLAEFTGGVRNLPILDEAAAGLGFFSFPPNRDGIVRTIPVVARAQEQMFPTLGVEALRVAQGAGSYIIRATGASGEADTGVPAMTALKVGALEVPTGPAGEMWIYFSGMPSLPTISAATLLDPAQSQPLEDTIAGRIVLVGSSAVGLRDLVATPLAASVAGVRVHAEVIDQIFGGTFLTRPDWAKGAEILAAVLLGVLLLLTEQKAGALGSAAAAIFLVAVALGISWAAFAFGQLLIDPIVPSAAVAAVFGVTMPLLLLLTDRERQFVRRAFTQYLAPSLVERLADNPQALKLGGEIREITILFSDIRGFTSLSEGLDPQELTTLLNNFLTPMTDVLLRSEATIDKYMGDAIMAFWNAPLDVPEHKRRACLAALDMLRALDELNARSGARISIGVGLNTGDCCVGNLGSAQRFSYSAIGDSVNVASRVEGQTKVYGVPVLMTESTYPGAAGLATLEVDLVKVLGRARPVALYTLIGDESVAGTPQFQALAAAHARFITAYRGMHWDAAEQALAEARGAGYNQLENLYTLLEKRIVAMRSEPPPAGWDGVYVSLDK
jgi:adenylate cyclase